MNRTFECTIARIPILSFFTGAGFLDLGFHNAGFEVIWRNEFDRSFVRGFEHGTKALGWSANESKVHNCDSIVDVGPTTIAKEAFANGRPKLFGIIGGPPCPDFSVGGKNKGSEGERGKLSEVYLNRIAELRPTFFVFENVPGLVRTEKHRQYLVRIFKSLSREYLVDLKILNALELGVPQDRQRVFVIGFRQKWLKERRRDIPLNTINSWLLCATTASGPTSPSLKDITSSHWFPWPHDSRYADAKRRFVWPTTNSFGEFCERPTGTPYELMVEKHIGDTESISQLPNGLECFRPKSEKFISIAEGDDSRKSFKRLHRWRYSPAAAYGNNEVHLHPTLPRRITVREAMRIQTVPDKYELPPEMPLSHKYKTIGNGVPVRLAEAVARSIRNFIEESENEAF